MPTPSPSVNPKTPVYQRWLHTCKRGASGIEYGILLGLMAIVTLVAIGSTGGTIRNALCDSAASIGAVAADPSLTCPGSPAPVWPYNVYFTGNYTTAGAAYSTTLAAATTSDNSTITYNFVSSSQPGGTLDPKSLNFTLPVSQPGVEQVVVNATTKGGTVQNTFYGWFGQVGDTGPYGTICAFENGSCTQAASYQFTLYCPSRPSLKATTVTRSGTTSCAVANGGDPAAYCKKVCAIQ